MKKRLRGLFHKSKSNEQSNAEATSTFPSAPPSIHVAQSSQNSTEAEPSTDTHPTPSLWERAYIALKEDDKGLVKDYEALLEKGAKEAQTAMAMAIPAAPSRCHASRREQFEALAAQGLRRLDKMSTTYTIAGHEFRLEDQISDAAGLVLWAKSWIGEATKASPEASIAWAGVALILPLFTNPTTAAEANRDGLSYVTSRLGYYTALEPLLGRLGRNPRVSGALYAEANNHLVDLYQRILAFQMHSVLRFYKGKLRIYAKDMVLPKDWKQMWYDVKTREATVEGDLRQINELAAREEIENLNATSAGILGLMQKHLVVSEAHLNVARQHLGVSKAQFGVSQTHLEILQSQAQQQLSEERQECLRLFYLTDNDDKATYETFKGRVEERVEGTCLWFLENEQFQKWLKQESGPLLVSADPGCGKSVLAKSLIDGELKAPSDAICYFFFRDQIQNRVYQAVCAILHQLFCQRPHLIEHAMRPFKERGLGLRTSTEALWHILSKAVRDPRAGAITIVVDALDECATGEFGGFMRNVGGLFVDRGASQLRLLMTSRPYRQVVSEFQSLFESFPSVHIPGEGEDNSEAIGREVNLVIEHRVAQLARAEALRDKTRDRLRQKLLAVENRTYLWVYLVFDYLKTNGFKQTEKGVDSILATLPTTVNDAYERILSKSKHRPCVRKILCIVLAAARPLTLQEMNVAVNINDTIDATLASRSLCDIDLEDDECFAVRLRQMCGLFVSVYQGKIFFLHQTAREFLLQTGPSQSPSLGGSPGLPWKNSISLHDAHKTLARVCMLCLAMDDAGVDRLPDGDGHPALLRYAADYWGSHLHGADTDDEELVNLALKLESSETLVLKWMRLSRRPLHLIQGSDEVFIPLLAASLFGHTSVVARLLSDGADANASTASGLTPLIMAAGSGYRAIIPQLLDHGAEINVTTRDGRTAVLEALQAGEEDIVKQLLERGADSNAADDEGNTPLIYAAARGHGPLVRQLLDYGANVEAAAGDGRTALMAAAFADEEAVVEQLLDHGANVDAVDRSGLALSETDPSGRYRAVAKLLQDHKAKMKMNNGAGLAP